MKTTQPHRILFISLSPFLSSYSSSMRNRSLIFGLLQLGHQVTVLSMQTKMVPESLDEITREVHKNNNLCLIDVGEDGGQNRGNSLDSLRKISMGWLPYIYRKLCPVEASILAVRGFSLDKLKGHTHFETLISSSDPKSSHYFARRLLASGLTTRRWIQYWGDPFALDITRKHMLPLLFISRMEERIMSAADKIIYTSPILAKSQQHNFPSLKDRISYVPTASRVRTDWDFPEVPPFRIGYHGSFSKSTRDIRPLIKACEHIGRDIELEIIGNGQPLKSSWSGLKYHEPVGNIEDYEKVCHVLAVVCNRTGFQLPGKVYHVAGTNRPVLAILDGKNNDDLTKYLTSFGRFEICRNDQEEIRGIILKLMSESNLKRLPPLSLLPNQVALKFLSGASEA